MNQETIFIPFFGMMLLTIVVWIYMYYLRLSYFVRNNVDPQTVSTTSQLVKRVPDTVNSPSENLINLFELPVLFYSACVYLYITRQVDEVFLVLAYCFLVFRIGHSIIHCTYNNVLHRFYVYLLSSLALWAFIIRAFISALTAG